MKNNNVRGKQKIRWGKILHRKIYFNFFKFITFLYDTLRATVQPFVSH
jgi:hypothetical protein